MNAGELSKHAEDVVELISIWCGRASDLIGQTKVFGRLLVNGSDGVEQPVI